MNKLLIIKKSMAISMTIMLTLAMLLSIVGSVMAQKSRVGSGSDVPAAPLAAHGPTDPAELETFLDDFFAKTLEEYHIAGAAISVVKDGKLFFAKGYGYADIEKGTPLTPKRRSFARARSARCSPGRQ